ncbi:MAG: porin [Sedimenticolaceae bacterium]
MNTRIIAIVIATASAASGAYADATLDGDLPGSVGVGQTDTPAKPAFSDAGVENLSDSALDLNTNNSLTDRSPNPLAPAGVISEYRASDAMVYKSPDLSGFSFLGTTIPGEDKDGAQDGRTGIADHWSVGGMYQGGGLEASLGYSSYDSDAANLAKTTATTPAIRQNVAQANASYTFADQFKLGGAFEYTDNYQFDAGGEYNAFAITGQARFGNSTINALYSYSNYNSETVGNERSSWGWGLGGDHAFSKRTKVYAAYSSAKTDKSVGGEETDSIFSLGMIHNF